MRFLVSFTLATCISRIDNQMEPVWSPGSTADQKLERVNNVIERLWVDGTWDGLIKDIVPVSSGGIITLDPLYKTIETLIVPSQGRRISIKSQQWKGTPSAGYIGDWHKYSSGYAFDCGDQNGSRVYELSGDPDTNDLLVFSAQVRFRYVWSTDSGRAVVPDCFQAILQGVRSMHWLDVGDRARYDAEFSEAIRLLEADLSDVQDEEDMGCVNLEFSTSGGALNNIL